MPKPRIVVFEDQDQNYAILRDALAQPVGADFEIERYDGKRILSDTKKWSDAEEWIRAALLGASPAILAVIDWDLSGFEHPAPQQFIRGIAEDQAIPTALYQSDTDAKNKL